MKKIQILMSLVFVKEECTQALLDFLSFTDGGRASGGVDEARTQITRRQVMERCKS
jgi:hypothetical protein